jgi:hypothetical protein
MLLIIFMLFLSSFSGSLAGGLVLFRLLYQPTLSAGSRHHGSDPVLDEDIQVAATQWAEAHDQPAAAPLVADKLRLAQALAQRRQRDRGRWSQW